MILWSEWNPRIPEFIKVVRICHKLRRPLIIPGSGPQTSYDSYPSQERLAQFVLKKIEKIKENDDEWEND